MNTYKYFKFLTIVWFYIVCSSLLGACRQHKPSASANQSEKSISVKVATIESQMIRNSSEFIANLESRQSVDLRPRVQGQVSRILVRPGDTIQMGTPIMQIDEEEQLALVESLTSEVDSVRANLQSARANDQKAQANLSQTIARLRNTQANVKIQKADLKKALADLKFNQDQYKRYKQLHLEGAVSSQVRDRFRNSLDTAIAALEAVEARIKAQQAEVESQESNVIAQQAEVEAQQAETLRVEKQIQRAQANLQEQKSRLKYYTITASFSGTVGDIPIKQGDFVNTETKLATLTQNDALEVNISIPVKRTRDINIGTPIELINAQEQIVGICHVFFISPNVINNTQSVLIKARLENSDRGLRADEFVQARVIWEKKPGLMVPTTAISRVTGETFVFVAEQSQTGLIARQKRVKLGNIEGNSYQVLDGLKPEERIIVSGLLQLSDGAAIVPES